MAAVLRFACCTCLIASVLALESEHRSGAIDMPPELANGRSGPTKPFVAAKKRLVRGGGQCVAQYIDSEACNSDPHCQWLDAAPPHTPPCIPRCETLARTACIAHSSYCAFHAGRCGLHCSRRTTASSCVGVDDAEPECLWDSGTGTCAAPCTAAKSTHQCLSTTMCAVFAVSELPSSASDVMSLLPDVHRPSASGVLRSLPGARFAGRPFACVAACNTRMSPEACAQDMACSWQPLYPGAPVNRCVDAGTRCGAVVGEGACRAEPGCVFLRSQQLCAPDCNGLDAPTCSVAAHCMAAGAGDAATCVLRCEERGVDACDATPCAVESLPRHPIDGAGWGADTTSSLDARTRACVTRCDGMSSATQCEVSDACMRADPSKEVVNELQSPPLCQASCRTRHATAGACTADVKCAWDSQWHVCVDAAA
eukprot:CAMPEP_0174843182 /NCGR_PEP_ID=MMETSP1114-20130205/10353_1 /TAXON_ID=312471 /ORGANISM="Neobodo designis, Strain CCAP 1951/1" /LENGTH=424 /DNA_ID=CAMNT_0016077397 /DNA_START=173 /DNA_END=1447 /DNA_ORIENTATION=+